MQSQQGNTFYSQTQPQVHNSNSNYSKEAALKIIQSPDIWLYLQNKANHLFGISAMDEEDDHKFKVTSAKIKGVYEFLRSVKKDSEKLIEEQTKGK